MNKVVIVSSNENEFKELGSNLELNNVNVIYSKRENLYLEDNALYLLDVEDIKDLDYIHADYKFMIITSSEKQPQFLVKSYKCGALECLLSDSSVELITVKILRYLNNQNSIVTLFKNKLEGIQLDFFEVISKDIKTAQRASADYTLIALTINQALIQPVRDFIDKNIRETDTSLLYDNNFIILSMPFCSKEGSKVVIDKLNNLMADKFKINVHFSAATLNIDGNTKEELLRLVVNEFEYQQKNQLNLI